mgnify:CR=1 FL=1
MYIGDAKMHDANFAFLTTSLAKLHTTLYEPKYWVTYAQDIPVDVGGGFVDYVSYYTVDWAGIMNEFRNVVGNNANYIPRVNAGLNQKRVNVYTFEVAYDLRFIELEKMKKLTLQKSIQEIYQNAIVAGWDLFVQKVAYTGVDGKTGLFNSDQVLATTIDNSTATKANAGFAGMTDGAVVAFFNGIFQTYLENTNMNISLLPDTILVPTFVGSDLTSRFSALYTSSLRKFLVDHNLAVDERMAEHQFICLLIANIANIELAVFSADDAIEHHVLQHIAQLLLDILVIALHQGVTKLESLLNRIRTKTLKCLLFIPWTLQAQTVLHIQQAAERRQFFFFRMSFSCITNHRFVQKLIILMQR